MSGFVIYGVSEIVKEVSVTVCCDCMWTFMWRLFFSIKLLELELTIRFHTQDQEGANTAHDKYYEGKHKANAEENLRLSDSLLHLVHVISWLSIHNDSLSHFRILGVASQDRANSLCFSSDSVLYFLITSEASHFWRTRTGHDASAHTNWWNWWSNDFLVVFNWTRVNPPSFTVWLLVLYTWVYELWFLVHWIWF